jgi:hypothetical protein
MMKNFLSDRILNEFCSNYELTKENAGYFFEIFSLGCRE